MSGSIAAALAKAQSEMGKALKTADNPHLRSKYADLGSVMDACLPALNANGIAVVQPAGQDGDAMFVETVLIHGESGQELRCRVPLIIGKRDMQGYGSAVTYARRYGLMCMAGIAPEDDDGAAAVASAPKSQQQRGPSDADIARDRAVTDACVMIHSAETMADLQAAFTALPPAVKADPRVIAAKDERKAALAKQADDDHIS